MSDPINSFGKDLGTLQYNGYLFGASCSVKVESTPVRDEADRTVLYVQHSITVHETVSAFTLSSDGAQAIQDEKMTSDYMNRVRQQLTQDGAPLYFYTKGFGEPLFVNTTNQKDVKFGPKTRMIAWEPAGGNRSVEFTWNVTVCLPQCSLGLQSYTGLMSFNYDVSFDCDTDGMTSRTISGSLQIAMTRLNKQIPDSADMYWDSIAWPTCPLGYTRQHRRTVSKDKAKLEFSITDTQIPSNNPWPEFCTRIAGSHHVRWSRSTGATYSSEIEMSITLEKGRPGILAFNYFNLFTADRMLDALSRGRQILLNEIEVNEDLFGLTHNFRVGYVNIGPVKDFLADNALWRPIGTEWYKWRVSLGGSTFARRGISGLSQPPGFDAIVDLCPGSEAMMPTQEGSLIPAPYQQQGKTVKNTTPSPGDSFMHYDASFTLIKNSQTARQKYLQKGPKPSEKTDPKSTAPYSDPPPESEGQTKPDKIIQRGVGSWKLGFKGSAVRAGHEVPRPAVKSVGDGVVLTEDESEYECKVVANLLGVPVYAATWDITYFLPDIKAANVHPPENPREKIDDQFQVEIDGIPV